MSNRVYNMLEQGGAVLAITSGLSGFISQNHDLIWGIGVVIGCIVGVIGLYLNFQRFQMDKQKRREESRINKLKIKELIEK